MAINSTMRQATKDEMACEIDRCHAVIEKLQTQLAAHPAPASAQAGLRDLALGDTYLEAGADYHTSGINVGEHGNRIQCYGRKPEDAEALRDEVWRALTATASAPEPVYKSVERILDEESAWISRPSDEVTRRIALAATMAAMAVLERTQEPASEPASLLLEGYDKQMGGWLQAVTDRQRRHTESIPLGTASEPAELIRALASGKVDAHGNPWPASEPAPASAPSCPDDGDPAPWAVAAERAASEAYAGYMGDPDGRDDLAAARRAAALAIEAHAPALVPSCSLDCAAHEGGCPNSGRPRDDYPASAPSCCGELREAAQKALNYIENTESELGITLSSGDALRSALAATAPRSGES